MLRSGMQQMQSRSLFRPANAGHRPSPHFWSPVVVLSVFICLTSCARQIAPSGGPPDKKPPTLVQVTPENNSTLVPFDQSIEFEFSESMNRKSLEKALFITPRPERPAKYKWKGRRLRIDIGDSLKANRTYVITLGTDLKDAHGNPLAQSYTLAFSTGAEISDGKIDGQVFNANKPRGVLIWAYILNETGAPDPVRDNADYVTQADEHGLYKLSHLSAGKYRIFAIEDKDGNRFFEEGGDGIGIPQQDILLASDSVEVENINFKVSIKDTLGPALSSVQAENDTHVHLRFDETLSRQAAEKSGNYLIRAGNKGTGDALQVRLAYVNPLDSLQVRLVTDAQQRGAEYSVIIKNVTDKSGNPMDENYDRDVFFASALPDTFKPSLLKIFPGDSARAVPVSSALIFYFSEAMRQATFERNFVMADTMGNHLRGAFDWPTPASVRFQPEQDLVSLKRYQVSIPLDSVYDIAGNSIADSLLEMHFTAINIDTLSSISGMVSDPDSTGTGWIFMTAKQKGRSNISYQIKLAAPAPYKFKNILPGQYTIEAFRDGDGNGKYSFGNAIPFTPSERFVIYADSIKVRARWPNEGNDIVFPRP